MKEPKFKIGDVAKTESGEIRMIYFIHNDLYYYISGDDRGGWVYRPTHAAGGIKYMDQKYSLVESVEMDEDFFNKLTEDISIISNAIIRISQLAESKFKLDD